MSTFLDRLKREPAVVVGVFVTALALFGINVAPANVEAITQAIVAGFILIGSLVTRSQVTPVQGE